MYENNKEAKFVGLLSVQFIKGIFCVFTEFTYEMVFNIKKPVTDTAQERQSH